MGIQISAWTARDSHFPRLIELGSTYYAPGHPVLNEAFLTWFYLDNPGGPATLIVAHEGDLWAGLIVLIPVTLECMGRSQKACYAVNVLTHPEHRGKNLFGKMIGHARDILSGQAIWLLGHPNASAIPGWSRQKMQFRDPLRLHLAKFRLPFSSLRENRIRDLQQLQAIPCSFWNGLANRTDIHLKYSPEFLAWRYLDAPHREYTVSAIYKRDDFLGLRVTRHFKLAFDLMVDFVGSRGMLSEVFSSVRRPTLIMHPGLGSTAFDVSKGCWKLPFKRRFPFFVTTWNDTYGTDMSGITLAASDF